MRFAPLLIALLALLAGPAQAAFTICNKSDHTAKVALGYFDGRHWSSQGWWTVKAKKCAGLIAGPLDARYYYLYATDSATGAWDGGKVFCTATTDKFAVAGRANCAGRGYDRKGFFEVDTGQDPNWTQSLSD